MPQIINITPLDVEHLEPLTADLLTLYRNRAITSVAFSFTLVPEGVPVYDKVAELSRRFRQFQERLKPSGLPVGILLQATIGHGWRPDSPAAFQRFTFPTGEQPYQFCPLDADFRRYVADAAVRLGALGADFMMLDDDFRMLTGRNGCFCPLHIARFNAETGSHFDREGLVAAVNADPEIARRYDRLLEQSLVEVAALIRAGFDRGNPQIPGSFCTCTGDVRYAATLAQTLAAPQQRPLVRINNARYLFNEPRSWPQWQWRTALQVATLPEHFEILAESDTFPHNRYSTSATVLHTHLTLSLLEGCHGAKQWTTRFGGDEPASGTAYRAIMARHAGFYKTVAALQPRWRGAVTPMPQQPYFNFPQAPHGLDACNWITEVTSRMGISAAYVRRIEQRPVLLAGSDVALYSDREIAEMLSGNVLLDGAAAIALTRRGHAAQLGVTAEAWSGAAFTYEKTANGRRIASSGAEAARLQPLDAACRIRSMLFHAPYALSPAAEELSPGCVTYTNAAGGTVTTLAGWIERFDTKAFFLLNETRKEQLLQLLRELGDIGYAVADDAEIWLRDFDSTAGRCVCAVNLGYDVPDALTLSGDATPVEAVEKLQPDGTFAAVPFQMTGDQLTIHGALGVTDPVIYRIRG